MTFILGMQCTDGVLIVSDCINIATSGKITNTGVKSVHGVLNGQPFALAFAGYAGIENGDQTLTVIEHATSRPTDNLVDSIGRSLQKWLYLESFRGRKRMRKEFRRIGHIRVLLSVRWNEWWHIHVKRKEYLPTKVDPGLIIVGQPGPNHAAWEQLKNAVPLCPAHLAQGKQVAGALFELATKLFPDAARYPGMATVHTAAGIQSVSFNAQAELV